MVTTERLMRFLVETTYADLPHEVVERGKVLVIDFVGGALAGSQTGVADALSRYVAEQTARPEASVIGRNFKTTASYAAYLNGSFNHETELESVSQKTSPNPLAVLAVSLSLGEKMGRTGKEILEAAVLGFEVQGRVGGASLSGVSRRGRISIFNHLGAVAAASKVLKLGVHRSRMALGIAAFQAGGLIANVGTSAHVVELAVAARDGIEAAAFADLGLTSHPDIIETPQGFCDALIDEGGYDLERMTKDLGRTYQVLEPGISIKKYPCCYRSHRALDALFEILNENRISYEEIENVTVDLNLYDSYLMKFPDPKTGEEAKFSYPHIMSAAILKGKVWVDSFTDASVRDPLLEEAKRKVSVVIHKEWPPGRVDARTPVTVTLKGGRRFSREINAPSEPTLEQLLGRYREAAQGIWTTQRTQRSIDLLLNLEKQNNLSPLMELLTIRE